MLAWSEGTDNGRQKTRNHGYDVIVDGRAIYWLLRSPSQTCHAKPKTQINRRRTLPASFPLVGCLPQAAWPERLLSKSQTLRHCSRLRRSATYDWSWWYPSGNRPLQQYLGFTAGRWIWSVQAWADSLIANSKKRAERSERLMYEQGNPAIISALVICIIVCITMGC